MLIRLKKQPAKLDLLILDELGYVPAGKLGAELLFDVTSAAFWQNTLSIQAAAAPGIPRRHGELGLAVCSFAPTKAVAQSLRHCSTGMSISLMRSG